MSVVHHWIVRGTTVDDPIQYTSLSDAQTQARVYATANPTENYIIYSAVSYAFVSAAPVVVQPVLAA